MKKLIYINLITALCVLVISIYTLTNLNNAKKEYFCRDVAHEAVMRGLFEGSITNDDQYTDTYYDPYNNCLKNFKSGVVRF